MDFAEFVPFFYSSFWFYEPLYDFAFSDTCKTLDHAMYAYNSPLALKVTTNSLQQGEKNIPSPISAKRKGLITKARELTEKCLGEGQLIRPVLA